MNFLTRAYFPKRMSTMHDPFVSFNEKLNQLLDGWASEANAPADRIVSDFNPALELKEDKDNYYVDVELTGIKPEEVDLTYNERGLSIRGERKSQHSEVSADKKTHYSERLYGTFTRTIPFKEEVWQEKIAASFKDGLLSVTLPKKPTDSPVNRKISIKS